MESIKGFREEYKNTIIVGLVCGLISHGAILFYKYMWHDDCSALFGVLPYGFGRWMTTLIGGGIAKLTSGFNYSTPLFNGAISIFVIAVSCCISLKILEIKEKYTCYGLVCIFVSFPVVVGTFGYMFLAPYYFFALLFSALGVYYITREERRLWLLGCICIGIAPAFYQAYIGCFLSLMLLWIIRKIVTEQIDWKAYIGYVVRLAFASIVAIGIYFTGLKLSLFFSGESLTSYEGISDVGSTGLKTYLSGLAKAYKYFVYPEGMVEQYRTEYAFMYPAGIQKYYFILLVIAIAMTALLALSIYKKKRSGALQFLLAALLLPVVINFIFIMCPSDATMIHSIMVYSQVYLFCYVAMCGEMLADGGVQKPVHKAAKFIRKLKKAGTVLICIFACLYVWFSNVTYMRMQMQYQQVTSDMTTLVACIKMSEGYDNKTPVAFVVATDYNHIERNVPKYEALVGTSYINPYGIYYMYSFLSKESLLDSLRNVCGFDPVIYDEKCIIKDDYVDKMPCWPNGGSISPYHTVDGNDIIVVKI